MCLSSLILGSWVCVVFPRQHVSDSRRKNPVDVALLGDARSRQGGDRDQRGQNGHNRIEITLRDTFISVTSSIPDNKANNLAHRDQGML
jgi:hypothetical protein